MSKTQTLGKMVTNAHGKKVYHSKKVKNIEKPSLYDII